MILKGKRGEPALMISYLKLTPLKSWYLVSSAFCKREREKSRTKQITNIGFSLRSHHMLSPSRLSTGLASVIILCLLTSSTPAAPQTLVALANESAVGFYFWFNNSGVRKLLLQSQRVGAAKKPEKQSDRDAKIVQIKIFPGSLTVDLDDK